MSAPLDAPPALTEAPSLQARLDAGGPQLRAPGGRRLNRRVLWLGAVVVLLLATLALVLMMRPAAPRAAKAPARNAPLTIPAFPPPDSQALPPASAGPVETAPVPALQADLAAAPLRRPPVEPAPVAPGPVRLGEAPVAAPAPTLAERRAGLAGAAEASTAPADAATAAWMQGLQRAAALSEGSVQGVAAAVADSAATMAPRAVVARRLPDPDTLLLRGTYIRCVLGTRVITDVDGFAACTVSEPVYSGNGRRLLLPVGTRVLGRYRSGDLRHERLAMVWDRITTPAGIDVDLPSPGVDGLGSAGHGGHYTAHWGQRIGAALFISLLGDAFKYAGERHGPTSQTRYPGSGEVVQEPFRSDTARTLQRLADQSVQAAAERRPTLTIAQGTRLNIYVAQDVDFAGVLRP